MKIGVLGSGMVAKALAGKLDALGHEVKLGTRDVAATLARGEPDMAGGPALRVWLESHPRVTLGTHAEAAAHGEIVVNALSGQGTLAGLRSAGARALAKKILIDVSNPLDFSKGMPPLLSVSNTDSLGEQIQRELPETKVVKDAQHRQRVRDGRSATGGRRRPHDARVRQRRGRQGRGRPHPHGRVRLQGRDRSRRHHERARLRDVGRAVGRGARHADVRDEALIARRRRQRVCSAAAVATVARWR